MVIGARDFAQMAAAIWKSPSSFETIFLLSSDICAETENFLCQSDDVAHLRTIYFALYECTHYCYYYVVILNIIIIIITVVVIVIIKFVQLLKI